MSLHQLLKLNGRKKFATVSVDVVLATGFRSDVMSADDVISGLLKRYPNANNLIQTTKPFLESMVPSFFHGAIHAEATLMGLISYFFLDDHERNKHDARISNPDTFKENFRPVCCHFCLFHSQYSLVFSGISKPFYRHGEEMLLVL